MYFPGPVLQYLLWSSREHNIMHRKVQQKTELCPLDPSWHLPAARDLDPSRSRTSLAHKASAVPSSLTISLQARTAQRPSRMRSEQKARRSCVVCADVSVEAHAKDMVDTVVEVLGDLDVVPVSPDDLGSSRVQTFTGTRVCPM